ncbi:MAG: transposase [Minisyncoccia bacterium]
MRNLKFEIGEFYHIYNRGVDKRDIFKNPKDLERFLKSMLEFNQSEPIGSIYENSFSKRQLGSRASKLAGAKVNIDNKLVNFVCYCLNTNHYHFLLEQVSENGIEKFMHRLGTGYTKYFNIKNKRSGALFQGKFKAVHVDSNEYLLHLSAYINLNNKVHKNNSLYKSSYDEYILAVGNFCKKDIILEQFKNVKEYKDYMKISFDYILENKESSKELEAILLD